MAIIRITDLKLKTIIGIYDWERKIKQAIIINISLEFDASKAAKTDSIKDTVDYKSLKKRIIDLVEGSHYCLLEKLVEEILNLIMADPKILNATVKIDKPKALRFAKSVSVESSRQKASKTRT